MRHVFILNPAAGKKRSALSLLPEIENFFRKYPFEHTVHVTERSGEATLLAQRETEKGDPVRLYACGGDGTLQEVVSGMVDAPHAELACVPCGSANDFIRFMPEPERFRDIASQVMGTARKVDAIRCNDKLSLNLCSMGMDADVGARMVNYKHLPLVSGPMAYNLAIVRTFFSPLGQKLRVVMDTVNGKVERIGNYLFVLAANGQYYGGGYHGSPKSRPDDGLLDFVLVKKLSHLNVLRFLGKYKRGEHLDLSCCESFCGTSMEVHADTLAVVNADGECFKTTEVSFHLLSQAISFVFPCTDPEQMLKKCEISENYQFTT
jgi:YegS/Rv2252/BmrU family lipid kinase